MKLIDIENKKPVIDPAALMIKEFKAIWDRDKTKDKGTALAELAYVYLSADYTSPYREYDGERKMKQIRDAVMSDQNWTPDKYIEEAEKRYKELQRTPSLGLLEDAEYAINKLRKYFRDTDISRSREGAAAKNLIYNLKQLGEVVKSVQALKVLVEEEQYIEKSIRGGGKLGLREVPKTKRK